MARLSSINKNNRRKKLVALKSKIRLEFKKKSVDLNLSFDERIKSVHKLAEMPRNSSQVRIRNRCELTGRARGSYRYFRLSRIMLREMANQGLIPGVIKASW